MNRTTIDTEHGLDDFDEEEKRMDPLVLAGFIMAFFSVIGVLGFYFVKAVLW